MIWLVEKDLLIEQQAKHIEELERRLNRNSQNSNNPPSTDQYVRRSKPQSERKKTGRRSGGQLGHAGTTRQKVDNPDFIYGVFSMSIIKKEEFEKTLFDTIIPLCDLGKIINDESIKQLKIKYKS